MKRSGVSGSRRIATLAGWATAMVALAGWSELLTKPVTAYRASGSIRKTIWDLIVGNGIYDGWLEGIMFLCLTGVLILTGLFVISRFTDRMNTYLSRSRVDISMLRTEITVRMEDVEMTTARITRRQLFHANAPDVQAYYYAHTPDVGHVDLASFSIETTVDGVVKTSEPEVVPIAGGKGIDITEPFSEPLPTSFLATYLSDRWVLALYKNLGRFRGVVASREVSFISCNEYNRDDPRYQLQFLRYPANEVTITLDFPGETAPPADEIKVLRMHENAATTIRPTYLPQSNRLLVSFTLFDAENERVRIRWSNRKLKEYLAGQRKAGLLSRFI